MCLFPKKDFTEDVKLIHKQQELWRAHPVGQDYDDETRAQVLTRKWREILKNHPKSPCKGLNVIMTKGVYTTGDKFRTIMTTQPLSHNDDNCSLSKPQFNFPLGPNGSSARVHVLPQDPGQEPFQLRQTQFLRLPDKTQHHHKRDDDDVHPASWHELTNNTHSDNNESQNNTMCLEDKNGCSHDDGYLEATAIPSLITVPSGKVMRSSDSCSDSSHSHLIGQKEDGINPTPRVLPSGNCPRSSDRIQISEDEINRRVEKSLCLHGGLGFRLRETTGCTRQFMTRGKSLGALRRDTLLRPRMLRSLLVCSYRLLGGVDVNDNCDEHPTDIASIHGVIKSSGNRPLHCTQMSPPSNATSDAHGHSEYCEVFAEQRGGGNWHERDHDIWNAHARKTHDCHGNWNPNVIECTWHTIKLDVFGCSMFRCPSIDIWSMGGCKHTHPNIMHVVVNVLLLKGYEPAAHSCLPVPNLWNFDEGHPATRGDISNAGALTEVINECSLTHRGLSEYSIRVHSYDSDHISCPAASAAFAALMLTDALFSRGSGKDQVLKLPYCCLLRRVCRVGTPLTHSLLVLRQGLFTGCVGTPLTHSLLVLSQGLSPGWVRCVMLSPSCLCFGAQAF